MMIETFYALNNVNFYRDGTYENIIRGLRTKGSLHWRGYYSMFFSGFWKEVHRLIAEGFVHNYAPKKLKIVDHIRGDGDNSADNLRYVNRKLNAINNKCLGVCFDQNGSWRVSNETPRDISELARRNPSGSEGQKNRIRFGMESSYRTVDKARGSHHGLRLPTVFNFGQKRRKGFKG